MTRFFCSLVYPLKSVKDPDRGAADRTRWEPQVSGTCLHVAEVEVVTTHDRWSSTEGFLVVHVESRPGADEQDALDELAGLARPADPAAVRLFESLRTDRVGVSWEVAPVRRVPTIALTEEPSDDRGSVNWPDSTAAERRIASLLVLREGAIEVDRPFEMEIAGPTPSYLLASSGPSTVLMRLRSLGKAHVERLRTAWVDVLVAELARHSTLSGLADRVRRGVDRTADLSWEDVQHEWRRWRTTQEWRVEADRPLELALERRVRAELGSTELGQRIAQEIDAHASAERLRQDRAMARAVLLLAVVAALVPLLLQVSQTGAHELVNGFFVCAVVVSLVVGGLALTSLRQRPRVAGPRRSGPDCASACPRSWSSEATTPWPSSAGSTR